MKHPAPEEWMTLLYGEATAPQNKVLTEHLAACGECRDQVANWRATMKSLDDGRAPVVRKQFAAMPAQWAAAAALLIGLGIVLGRFVFSPDEARLRAALESHTQQQVAAMRTELTREFEERQSAALRQVIAAADVKIAANAEKLSEQFARTLDATRAADREVFLAAITELDDKRQEQIGTLRKGLETMVLLTDYGFEATQQRLAQLTASDQSAP